MVAKKVREIRRLQGLTQAEFSRRIGVSSQTISNWENEVVPVPKSAIKNICREFDVTEEYLLGKGKPPEMVFDSSVRYMPPLGKREKKLRADFMELVESGEEDLKDHLRRQLKILIETSAGRKKGTK